jgi:PAS domain S-box-containing protein
MSHSGSKRSPSIEIVSLRKQVADLKESATARRRVEDALREAEMLHRACLDECPAGIIRLDPRGRVLYLNAAFIYALGYEHRHDFKTIGELRGVFADPEEVRRLIEQASGPPSEMVIRCLRRDGSCEALVLLVGRIREEGLTLVHIKGDRVGQSEAG